MQNATIAADPRCSPTTLPQSSWLPSMVTSLFRPCRHGDRPPVVPIQLGNFGVQRTPPPVYKGTFDPRVLFEACIALHDFANAPAERGLDAHDRPARPPALLSAQTGGR